ncbi:MAG: hypothetical protein HYR86_07780 [Candidatus Rokubacteria bacterium]|nr:hypothetical protein [Candidatus Rokubacteria bacterium]
MRVLIALATALTLAIVPGALGADAPLPTQDTAKAAPGSFRREVFLHRPYAIHVPSGVQPVPAAAPNVVGVPAAGLVIALHGCWQTPEDFAQGTRLNAAADQRRLVVVYPLQSRSANLSRCWNWFEPALSPGSETLEIATLARHLADVYGVARERTVAVGLSAGGFMAVNLACAAPDLVAGVGVVAGGPFRCGVGVEAGLQCMRGQNVNGEASATACLTAMGRRGSTVRASLWQGGEDAVVNPANVAALAVMFARVNGVSARAVERREGASVTVYRDAAGRPVVEAWLVPDVGHAWSGGDPRGTHTSPHGPDTTRRMLDFLLGPV